MKSEQQDQFDHFISRLGEQSFYKKAITHQSKFFQVTVHQLHKISPKGAKDLREFILQKRQQKKQVKHQQIQQSKEKTKRQSSQHEKRLFTWLLLCFLEIHHKTVDHLNEKDYQFLADISAQKSIPEVKYLVHSLLKQQKRPVWTKQEDALLQKILAQQKKFETTRNWSSVSKQLFLRGDHKSYKSGKNCRERWCNHVNPEVKKEWTLDEDIKLFQFVSKQGKKWSKIIPELNNTKSEHMIKNRFNSQTKKMQSQLNQKLKEADLLKALIEKLTKEKRQKQSRNQLVQSQVYLSKEEQPRRILRSDSLRSQLIKNSQDNIEIVGLEDKMAYEEQIKFLFDKNLIKEDEDQQTNKNNGDFKLFQSMRLNITSPIPPTPFQLCGTPKAETSSFKTFTNNFTSFLTKFDN